MDNNGIALDFLLPDEQILWQHNLVNEVGKPEKDKGVIFLLEIGRVLSSILGITALTLVLLTLFSVFLELFVLLVLPVAAFTYLAFKRVKTTVTSDLDSVGKVNYFITNQRVIEIQEKMMWALAYEEIYDIGYYNEDESSNTLIFSNKYASTNLETIDYGQLTYDFFKAPISVQEEAIEICFLNLPNVEETLTLAWKEWKTKGPFADVDKTLNGLKHDFKLDYQSFKLGDPTAGASLSGTINGLDFYLELTGRQPIREFFIEILCPNPTGYNFFLEPQYLPAYLREEEEEEEDELYFDDLFEIKSDNEGFVDNILSLDNQKLLQATHAFYPGKIQFGDSKKIKKTKEQKVIKIAASEEILDADMLSAEKASSTATTYEEGQGTWLLYSCNFANLPSRIKVPMPELIEAAFRSTVALAKSIDGYFEE